MPWNSEIGFAELFAFLRVLAGEFPRSARYSDHLRADSDAAFVECFDRDLVSLAHFAQDVFFGHAAIFQNQFAGRRGANAELVFLFADGETGKIFFDQKRGDAFVSLRGIDRRKQNEESGFLAIRDPEFPAVENEVAAFQVGLGLQRERV